MLPGHAAKRKMPIEKIRPYLLSRIPAGRFGEPADVAGVAIFLASAHRDYLTGEAINVTGGSPMH